MAWIVENGWVAVELMFLAAIALAGAVMWVGIIYGVWRQFVNWRQYSRMRLARLFRRMAFARRERSRARRTA